MNVLHGFFICDEEYLVNLQGLIEYLSEKIKENLEGIREMISIQPDDFEQQFAPKF